MVLYKSVYLLYLARCTAVDTGVDCQRGCRFSTENMYTVPPKSSTPDSWR